MQSYVLGIDFGTLSGRAVLVRVSDGNVMDEEVMNYAHGVLDEALPSGEPLPHGFALACIEDYIAVLEHIVPALCSRNKERFAALIGIGIDCTATTFLPVDENGRPLSENPRWKQNPHAYMKLWKHHGATHQAECMTKVMREIGSPLLSRAGGRVNPELMLPKLLEICEEAPDVYEATTSFEELSDFLCRYLTGEAVRSLGPWQYKMLKKDPEEPADEAFYAAVNPAFTKVEEKLIGRKIPLGSVAGYVKEDVAKRFGIPNGTPVAAGNMDAHAAYPSFGIQEENAMVLIIGTSLCALLASKERALVPGIYGAVDNGLMPGLVGYEAGQSGCGDILSWFVHNGVPAAYEREAETEGIDLHTLLTKKAAMKKPKDNHLIALDWWNGNRSCLSDATLKGLLVGLTMDTKPEDIYRALLEAIAFGTREIIENYEKNGVRVGAIYASGGIAKKNPFFMQIFADVLHREIFIGASSQASALGAAIYASVAAGPRKGGFLSVWEASKAMGRVEERSYRPIPENVAAYDDLFREYHTLHDYFGRGENDVMKRL